MRDDLGDRMKSYETLFTKQSVDPYTKCVYARLDGRSFSRLTKNLNRPFDMDFSNAMVHVMKTVATQFKCDIAYCQSDEISLGWNVINAESQLIFNGKIQKLASTMAALASVTMLREVIRIAQQYDNETWKDIYLNHDVCFDCRVFELPNPIELYNAFEWRYQDCKRNWVSQWARSVLSHKDVQGKSTKQMIDMMEQLGHSRSDIPDQCKYGTLALKARSIDLGDDMQAPWPSDLGPSYFTISCMNDTFDGYLEKKAVFDLVLGTNLVDHHLAKGNFNSTKT